MYFIIDRMLFKNNQFQNKNKHRRVFVAVFGLWIVFLAVASLSGFTSDFSSLPPKMFIVVVPPLIGIILLVKNWKSTDYLSSISPYSLIYLQIFRVPVEIILWYLHQQNKIPIQMTFEGLNYDIISGFLPFLVVILMKYSPSNAKNIGITYNVVGLLLLLNIVVIAILSFPTPFRYFMEEPTNTLLSHYPAILLPGLLVPIAYYAHIYSIKQLMRIKN
jgi:uncharacterized membrane protein